ncbi:hypothetical protein PpBr36_08472 [Pyricularia pennisetigena]|uniref:hypothetical protein n=1 Tax=Pyricularia pennisetigena TaxID=1578925 RepID=UPI0011525A53|nr:hypothetical protein PpBr36_08472 [Pyricularia pennisetigena]TLS24791.1 hypothetical protein PpBr36_08472 [Pyricularia pennisetigena]
MTSAAASPTTPPTATAKFAIPLPIASPPITPLLTTPVAVFVIIVGASPRRRKAQGVVLANLLFDLDGRRVELGIPARVGALLAQPAVGAEAAEVVGAQVAPDVLLAAPGAERTEALVVVRTGRQLALRVDVQVQALLAVLAVAVADVKVALGHAAQVVLVQELAPVALLAQPAQPTRLLNAGPSRFPPPYPPGPLAEGWDGSATCRSRHRVPFGQLPPDAYTLHIGRSAGRLCW